MSHVETCPACNGSRTRTITKNGETWTGACVRCGGTGEVIVQD